MPHTITDWAMLYVIVVVVLCVLGYCHLQWQAKTQSERFVSPKAIKEAMGARLIMAALWPIVLITIFILLFLGFIFRAYELVSEIITFKTIKDKFSLENLGSVLIRESDELISEDDLLPDDRVALDELRRDIARFESTNELDS